MTPKKVAKLMAMAIRRTLPRTSPDGGGLRLSKTPLNATIGQVLQPIMTIGHACAVFYVFIIKTVKKGLRLTLRPLFSIGVLHIKQKRRP
jgi:hypothetical protein